MTREGGRLRGCGLGDPVAVIDAFARLRAGGEIPDGSLLELPRVDLAALTGRFDVGKHEHWSILWTRRPHPAIGDDSIVEQLSAGDHDDINALLDAAFPETRNRPGRPEIHRWFGVREGGELVAVGADRSVNGVGYMVAIAVHPGRQGRGYGAAVTGRLTRELLSDTDLCALGVVAANRRARRLYRRMGFAEGIDLTSITLR